MDCVGIGIIGAGGISRDHARGVADVGRRARLIGVADLSGDRLREFWGRHFAPLAWTDHRELLDRPDIDLVTVCTPPNTHEALVIESLEAGKAVLCEKPLAHTLASADRIIAAAERYPGKLCVSHQLRHDPSFERLRWLVEQGWLGDLSGGSMERFSMLSGKFGTGWWGRWDVAGGGVVITQCIHQLDLMIRLLGRPVEVAATMSTEGQPIESEDTFEAQVWFESGAVLKCAGSVYARQPGSAFRVEGGKGSADLSGAVEAADAGHARAMRDAVEVAFAPPKPMSKAPQARVARKLKRMAGLMPPPVRELKTCHGRLINDYLNALHDGQPAPVSPAEARLALELCVAIYTSAITGSKVSLPLDSDARFYYGISADDYRGIHTLTA